jgi:hypothetical protein
MHRNGKRIALSLVAIVLGAGFLLKVIPPETVIGDNDHHTASIDGLLITNPVDVNDPVAPALFPPAFTPAAVANPASGTNSSPLWIPGEPTSEQSLSSPALAHVTSSSTNAENPKSTVQDSGSDDKSRPGSGVDSPKPGNSPGPLLHDPKDSNGGSTGGGGGNNGGGGNSQPSSPGSGSDNNNPPPQDGPPPPETGPNNPPPGDSSGDDGEDKPFPPTGPGDFPDDNTNFPSDPGIPPGTPGGGDFPGTPHSVPDQGSSLALTFAGLILLGAVKRSLRR